MKIKLLFVPRYHQVPNTGEQMGFLSYPPLGISTLTSYLQKNHIDVAQDDLDIKTEYEIDIRRRNIDLSVFNDKKRVEAFLSTGAEETLEENAEKILRLTGLGGYDVVGLSVENPDNISTASVPVVMAKLLKEEYGCTVLLGGAINDVAESHVLASGWVDYGIIGSCETAIGEINLLSFCEAFEQGVDLGTLPGVKHFSEGKVRWNWRPYTRAEKYQITTPTFDGLPLELYRRPRHVRVGDEVHTFRGLVLMYYFMRGCPHNCAFCSQSKEQMWATKSPETIAEELQDLSHRYKTRYFYFHNPLVNPTYMFADRLADALIKKDVNILWSDCATLAPMDRPLLEKLHEAGARRLVFGFESASERVVSLLGKPFTLNQASNTIREAHEAGIWTELDLICGFPYERDADTQATIRFLEAHQKWVMSCNINKFWMEGRYLLRAEEYGIRYRTDDHALHKDWSVMEFDELSGLQWKERVALTNRTYDCLRGVIDGLFVPSPSLHSLFVYCEDPTRWRVLKNALQGTGNPEASRLGIKSEPEKSQRPTAELYNTGAVQSNGCH